jgi:two-component system cell cycle response regulator DivK
MAGELILIVEDDAKSRRLLRDVLEHEGYAVAEAAAGDEGVRLARALRPALVLMDVQLPVLDGVAALGLLRADPATRAMLVVAVTASAMAHERPRIRAAGFDGYQEKPIGVRDVLALVRRLLDGRPEPAP